MKFTLDRVITSGSSRTFRAGESADDALAAALLALPGVAQVFFLNDFISVTRTPETDWGTLQASVEVTITAHFADK
jgi:hypothetical protein